MAGCENRSGAYVQYVSTGSAEAGHMQAGFIGIPSKGRRG